MAASAGPFASFMELGLEDEREFRFDSKMLSVGRTWEVTGAGGRPLFRVKRPAGQAVATELAASFLAPGRRRHSGREPVVEKAVEHRMPRTYELSVADGRPLGRIRKQWGARDVDWTFELADGEPPFRARVISGGLTSFRAELLDDQGHVSLWTDGGREFPRPPVANIAPQRAVIYGHGGEPVAEFYGKSWGGKVRVWGAVYPLYPLFLSIITMYEMDTGD